MSGFLRYDMNRMPYDFYVDTHNSGTFRFEMGYAWSADDPKFDDFFEIYEDYGSWRAMDYLPTGSPGYYDDIELTQHGYWFRMISPFVSKWVFDSDDNVDFVQACDGYKVDSCWYMLEEKLQTSPDIWMGIVDTIDYN